MGGGRADFDGRKRVVEVSLLNCICFSLESGIAKIIYMGNRNYSPAKSRNHSVRFLVRIRYSKGDFVRGHPRWRKASDSKESGIARSVIARVDCMRF